MNAKHRALVLGATGLVGQQLVRQLLEDPRYSEVACLVRKPLSQQLFGVNQKLQPMVIDFADLDEYAGYFSFEHIYVCLGTTIRQAGSQSAFRKVDFEYVHAAAQLAALNGAHSFVWISSVGANAKSGNFYLRVKGELEDAIMGMSLLQRASAVRPSLLLGERTESRPTERLGIAFGNLIAPLMVGPLRKYRPIEASRVAQQMIALQHF